MNSRLITLTLVMCLSIMAEGSDSGGSSSYINKRKENQVKATNRMAAKETGYSAGSGSTLNEYIMKEYEMSVPEFEPIPVDPEVIRARRERYLRVKDLMEKERLSLNKAVAIEKMSKHTFKQLEQEFGTNVTERTQKVRYDHPEAVQARKDRYQRVKASMEKGFSQRKALEKEKMDITTFKRWKREFGDYETEPELKSVQKTKYYDDPEAVQARRERYQRVIDLMEKEGMTQTNALEKEKMGKNTFQRWRLEFAAEENGQGSGTSQ